MTPPISLGLGLGLPHATIEFLATISNYFRPDGISAYKQPDGSYYIRP